MAPRRTPPGWVAAIVVIGGICIPPTAPTVTARQGTLEDLLHTVGRYVRDYERAFSAVVSTERYVQRVRAGGRELTRDLRSEVALVAIDGGDWLVFRDVHAVDGHAVTERRDRLVELFMKPAPDIGAQARRIAAESARYSLGPANRPGVSTPTQALEFVRLENQPRSTFRLGNRERVDGVDVRELRFEEHATPRLIETADGVATRGRVWVHVGRGTVVRTEISVTSKDISALIQVRYAEQPALALWVPVQMMETYDVQGAETLRTFSEGLPGLRAAERVVIEGRAAYSDFRRFSVSTSEIIR